MIGLLHAQYAAPLCSQPTPKGTHATGGRTPPRNGRPDRLRESLPAGEQTSPRSNSQEANHFGCRTQEDTRGSEGEMGKDSGKEEMSWRSLHLSSEL